MPIEIEKKYHLTKAQRHQLLSRLAEIGAQAQGEEFEENTLYYGEALEPGRSILRLRRIGGDAGALLTYKERLPSAAPLKLQREEETQVADAESMAAILTALHFTPALVYEKRRMTWRLEASEIVIDELPFGLFMEIEGPEAEITKIEDQLAIAGLRAEPASYPELTRLHGKLRGSLIEARFA